VGQFENRLTCETCQPGGSLKCPRHWMTVPHADACKAPPGSWDTQCPRCIEGQRRYERELTYATLNGGAAEAKATVAGPGEGPLSADDPRLEGGNRWLNRDQYSTRRAVLDTPEPELPEGWTVETVLEEAQRLVQGPRQSSYSHPAQDFRATGRQWGAILENWLRSLGWEQEVPDIPPRIVALMMTNLKLSREAHKPKRDNRVDGAGYLLCADMIVELEESDD